MKVLIVEDEKLAAERLQTLLYRHDPSIELCGHFETVEDTVGYLDAHPHPDLMLLDIHLADGPGFDIFKQVQYNKPVIFTTSYNEYALQTFQFCSIDYILKPVTQEALSNAINKLNDMAACFAGVQLASPTQTHWVNSTCYKKRFIGKVGSRLFFVNTDDIAYFQADNKIVYLVDKQGNRYLVDYTLETLEQVLNPVDFFRLNRRYIVHSRAIEQIRPFHNHRLKLSVTAAVVNEDMVISRERVADFKRWADA